MSHEHEQKHRSPRAKRREEAKRRTRIAVPFFAVLFALTIVAFILPLRPTESASEKRKLTEFPAFSVDTLLSGEYFDGIGLWFSDTFPFRDYWLSVSARLGDASFGAVRCPAPKPWICLRTTTRICLN